jgi:hypothetical protein
VFTAAVIVSLNYFMLFTYPDVAAGGDQRAVPARGGDHVPHLAKPRLAAFILTASGLADVHGCPTCCPTSSDWSTPRESLRAPSAGDVHRADAARPDGHAEWMINANSFLIVLCGSGSHIWSRMRRVLDLRISIASIGLLCAGFTMSGIAHPRHSVLLGGRDAVESQDERLPRRDRARRREGPCMGYANMPAAIGWAYGCSCGQIYDSMGDK